MKNKLLNFTICQIFVFVMILLSRVKCQEQKLPSVQNVTSFDRSFEKVLSRRKRFLVWRPGSNLLLTASLVKPLVFPRPTGHNVILEWDIFYPLPINWRKPEPPTPKPPPASIPSNSGETKDSPDSHDFHDSHNSGEIWMPSGGWSPDSDVIKTLSESDAQSADRRKGNLVQKTPQLRRNDLLQSPQLPVVTQYRNPLLYNQQWQQSPQRYSYNSKGKVNLSKQYYQQVSKASKSYIDAHKQQSIGRSIQTVDEDHEESMDDSWEHHYAHRDRRELYHRIETTSPLSSFDVKSCLLRTICEAQHFLHPPGYSLLQDMLRVIFTIPIKDEMVDDYSNAMRANDQDCVRTYSEKCPMSILAFLLRSKN